MLTTLSSYLEELDKANPEWQQEWSNLRETYLAGHFLLTRPKAWSLPTPVVGGIKTGLRRDDPAYKESSGKPDSRTLSRIKEAREEETKDRVVSVD